MFLRQSMRITDLFPLRVKAPMKKLQHDTTEAERCANDEGIWQLIR
jgi:hypothetical protein